MKSNWSGMSRAAAAVGRVPRYSAALALIDSVEMAALVTVCGAVTGHCPRRARRFVAGESIRRVVGRTGPRHLTLGLVWCERYRALKEPG